MEIIIFFFFKFASLFVYILIAIPRSVCRISSSLLTLNLVCHGFTDLSVLRSDANNVREHCKSISIAISSTMFTK